METLLTRYGRPDISIRVFDVRTEKLTGFVRFQEKAKI